VTHLQTDSKIRGKKPRTIRSHCDPFGMTFDAAYQLAILRDAFMG
jgi:hypothetical protein